MENTGLSYGVAAARERLGEAKLRLVPPAMLVSDQRKAAPQAPGSNATRGKCRAPAERQRASWRVVRRVSENYSGNLAIWFEK